VAHIGDARREQITLDRADGAYSVVERTIRRGLGLPD